MTTPDNVVTLTNLFTQGKRRTPEAEARLRDAYVKLFDANGTKEDADLVLIDLLVTSGYFFVADAPQGAETASDATLRELNGSRRVGARIAYLLNWSPRKLAGVQQAILDEDATDRTEGPI